MSYFGNSFGCFWSVATVVCVSDRDEGKLRSSQTCPDQTEFYSRDKSNRLTKLSKRNEFIKTIVSDFRSTTSSLQFPDLFQTFHTFSRLCPAEPGCGRGISHGPGRWGIGPTWPNQVTKYPMAMMAMMAMQLPRLHRRDGLVFSGRWASRRGEAHVTILSTYIPYIFP